jgi:predicted nucleic acid-binding protein
LTDRVLIDTGPIVALLMESDQYHEACLKQVRQIRGPLLTCWPVITEAAWLLRAYRDAVRRLLATFYGRPFQILPLGEEDLPAIASILAKYRNLEIQLADAALMHLADREGIDSIFTLDRRDFGVMRLAHGKRPHLIP